jgi:hypothetical protein
MSSESALPPAALPDEPPSAASRPSSSRSSSHGPVEDDDEPTTPTAASFATKDSLRDDASSLAAPSAVSTGGGPAAAGSAGPTVSTAAASEAPSAPVKPAREASQRPLIVDRCAWAPVLGADGADAAHSHALRDQDGARPLSQVFLRRANRRTQRFYVVASNQSDTRHRILKIDRMAEANEPLAVTEDATIYSERELHDLIGMIKEGNKGTGGFSTACDRFYGIIGASSTGTWALR